MGMRTQQVSPADAVRELEKTKMMLVDQGKTLQAQDIQSGHRPDQAGRRRRKDPYGHNHRPRPGEELMDMDKTAIGVMDAGEATQMMSAPAANATQMAMNVDCPVCHTPNPPSETYCIDCGFLLSSAPIGRGGDARNAVDGQARDTRWHARVPAERRARTRSAARTPMSCSRTTPSPASTRRHCRGRSTPTSRTPAARTGPVAGVKDRAGREGRAHRRLRGRLRQLRAEVSKQRRAESREQRAKGAKSQRVESDEPRAESEEPRPESESLARPKRRRSIWALRAGCRGGRGSSVEEPVAAVGRAGLQRRRATASIFTTARTPSAGARATTRSSSLIPTAPAATPISHSPTASSRSPTSAARTARSSTASGSTSNAPRELADGDEITLGRTVFMIIDRLTIEYWTMTSTAGVAFNRQ